MKSSRRGESHVDIHEAITATVMARLLSVGRLEPRVGSLLATPLTLSEDTPFWPSTGFKKLTTSGCTAAPQQEPRSSHHPVNNTGDA
jgi:hypothetical protein